MTYFWIRPLCRFFGLLFLLLGATGFLSSLLYVFDLLGTSGARGYPYPVSYAVEAISRPLVYFGIGSWLFWGARSVERLVCRGLHPPGCCPRCGYNLGSSGLSRCPECGHVPPAGQEPPGVRG